MMVNVLLSGRLKLDGYRQHHPMNGDGTFHLALGDGSTVREVIQGIVVPGNQVVMTMINGRECQVEEQLKSGDRVILIPADVAALWRFLGNQNLGAESVFDFEREREAIGEGRVTTLTMSSYMAPVRQQTTTTITL